MVKPLCSNCRIITAILSGVRIVKIFMVPLVIAPFLSSVVQSFPPHSPTISSALLVYHGLLYNHKTEYDPWHEKTCLMPYENNN